MTGPRQVTVTVPATSANLGPGFDTLGLALGRYDEIRVTVTDGAGIDVEVEGEAADEVPRDASHLVVRSMKATYAELGLPFPGVAMRCLNTIPHGRGLGSSAAAIVGGVLAARALASASAELDEDATLALAARLEGHPDNVAACLLGGLTVAWQEGGAARAVRIDPAPEIEALVFVPAGRLSTEAARGMLPDAVPHADASFTAGRAALLVEALTRRPELLFAATEDRLHQRYRSAAMPETAALLADLRAAGVAAVVSGAGPSILVLRRAAEEELAVQPGDGWTVLRLRVDTAGARTGVAG